jgi:hypothetical protein
MACPFVTPDSATQSSARADQVLISGMFARRQHKRWHVVVVEVAGYPAGALRLWPIADFDRECDDLDGVVLPAEIAVGDRRICGL